jgi:hypothetical protein
MAHLVELDRETREFYVRSLRLLNGSGIPFQVGGAYAMARYTGIERHTKDLDLFVTAADADRVLRLFSDAGLPAGLTFPHWLGKVYAREDEESPFLDIIFGSGNGLARVDAEWMRRGVEDVVMGEPVRLCPPEEILWSKAFIMERERFDGADVAHLIRAHGDRLDWEHVLTRFGPHWRVLFSHLVLFRYVYPGERAKVPAWVEARLRRRLEDEGDTPPVGSEGPVCFGTFLSREQYLVDLRQWGYRDARVERGAMTPREVDDWTAAIGHIR